MFWNKTKTVYLDHAAATPVAPEVLDAMAPFWATQFGNPGALHAVGRAGMDAIVKARKGVAEVFGTQPGRIIFTNGGTESVNMAILGAVRKSEKKNVIATPVEHKAVLSAVEVLKQEGSAVEFAPVNEYGQVDAEQIVKMITDDTALISVMYANNEIGSVNDIAALGRALLKFEKENGWKPLLHVDACQAPAYLPLKVESLHVDLMSINGGKIYGPKGIGALFVKKGVALQSVVVGGGQEFGLRAGTENVPAIVGLATALQRVDARREEEKVRQQELNDWFVQELAKAVPDVKFNGDPENRLPNNVSVTIEGVAAEALLYHLDERGIAIATGSACTSSSTGPSHVLSAIGMSAQDAKSTVRISFGESTTKKQLHYVVAQIKDRVEFLRENQPVGYTRDR